MSSVEDLSRGPNFVYLQDNHTSVVGIREYAIKNGAHVYCASEQQLLQLLQQENLQENGSGCTCNTLLAYPAQSNYCGRKYPLQWIDQMKSVGGNKRWYVCLDAASLVANSDLNLSTNKPDFVTISFYKMFGYPTGLGALLVKNESAHVLKKQYFSGGTVTSYLPGQNLYKYKLNLSEK